jgi:hypothetical protein
VTRVPVVIDDEIDPDDLPYRRVDRDTFAKRIRQIEFSEARIRGQRHRGVRVA